MIKLKQIVRKALGTALISMLSASAIAQTAPGSDIVVASVGYENNTDGSSPITITLSDFQRISDSPSYTNQPYFIQGDSKLAFTQSVSDDTASQMDTLIYTFKENSTRNLTKSTTSEYSPTPTPDGKGLSVIRVNAQGKQELWYLDIDTGKAKQNLLPAIEPVGYHVWNGQNSVLLFVLGEPHTLRIAGVNKETDQGRVLDTNIGPSLWAIPKTALFSYSKQIDEETWQLRSINSDRKTTDKLVDMPLGSYYYAWSPKGVAVTAVDNTLYQWFYGNKENSAWSELADLSEQCPVGISRLTFSERGDKLALVCNRTEEASE